MNEEIKHDIYNEIEEQVTIIRIIKDKLDEELGENTYPVELLVSVHNWVNKWLISKAIEERQQQRNNSIKKGKKGKRVKVILKDGEKRTIDVKDALKTDGWQYDSDKKAWFRTMEIEDWKKIAGFEPYRYLKAEFEEA